jgi:hypothetical protein
MTTRLPRRLAPVLFLLVAGCAPPGVEQAEVSGKVLYRGAPLPGGVVMFMSATGLSGSAAISPSGEYRLMAPLGDLKVSVDNRMLRRGQSGGGYRMTKAPSEAAAGQPLAGQYVPVPEKYAALETSGLTAHVAKGSQTFDIKMD